jgi:hypothetical protein
MSIARHHTEWLSLVPTSGPFLSLPVLLEAFPSGLEPHDSDHARLLRQEYSRWQDSNEKRKVDPTGHLQWIKFVLTRTLELDEPTLLEGQAIPQTLQFEVREQHELLKPSIALKDPSTDKPRLLVQVYPRTQDLSSYVQGSIWKTSPDTRMTELLHATGVRLGLVTNGEHWMLVDAPKQESTGYASWYAALWQEEPITLRSFRTLLGAQRFFNVPDDQTLESLFAKSASNQQEVTYQLGYQVRRAVEVLIASLNRADQDFGRKLLEDIPESKLYESALTVMMRLVFLFCAEERELIPSKPFPVYDQNYSVSTISRQLRELADQHGEELLERRYDAWLRLLSAFRVVHGGLKHDDLHIPAYGGSLFDPDRFAFLEGRKEGSSWRSSDANPLPVNNRTVLHLLEALQFLETKVPGSSEKTLRRVSFRALDILQIGHVYEGLLDHTAKKATEPYLGIIGTRDQEPEIPLAELEKLLEKGEEHLLKRLKEETGKTPNSLKKAFQTELEPQVAAKFRTACQVDEKLWKRVEPLAGLVRLDSFGYPWVVTENSYFVTSGTDRRSSGTYYTPRIFTEPVVKHTLDPLVYVGPAEGRPENEWKLKSAKEILELKVCDMACGSGAFLVEACRYLAARLMEAWAIERSASPESVRTTPIGSESSGAASESIIPGDPREQEIYAMRLVAQRCLYGVDINPLAAEMAKLSLWLLTMSKDKPFEFLDHNIRSGDSLVGLSNLDQLRYYSLKPVPENEVLFRGPLDHAISEAIDLRLKLEDMPSNTVEDVQRQEELLKEATLKMAKLHYAADMLVSAEFWGQNATDKLHRTQEASRKSAEYFDSGDLESFKKEADKERNGQKMFHWPLEFPEVMVKRGGFDAFVGNPPFSAGAWLDSTLGTANRRFLVWQIANEVTGLRGTADLCAYFLLQSWRLVAPAGYVGMVLTNTISQGDTRAVGLDQICNRGHVIYRAIPTIRWPGTASLEVALLWLASQQFAGVRHLIDKVVSQISSALVANNDALPEPFELLANSALVCKGHELQGDGFKLTPTEADEAMSANKANTIVIQPLLTGDDINNSPGCQPVSWAVNFATRTIDEAKGFPIPFEYVEQRVKPERMGYTGSTGRDKYLRKYWWLFRGYRQEIADFATTHSRVLVRSVVSKHSIFTFVPSQTIFTAATYVFLNERYSVFASLQSSLHDLWALFHGSTLETRPRYIVGRCFKTFPLKLNDALESIGNTYFQFRNNLSTKEGIGLTDVYNRFHNLNESSTDSQTLRDLHVEMDNAVAAAYGWTDLKLDHGFHETKQGVRYTISEPARREVLQRLLMLNHERYAEEVKKGLHGKKKTESKKASKPTKKSTPKKKKASNPPEFQQPSLFDEGEGE